MKKPKKMKRDIALSNAVRSFIRSHVNVADFARYHKTSYANAYNRLIASDGVITLSLIEKLAAFRNESVSALIFECEQFLVKK